MRTVFYDTNVLLDTTEQIFKNEDNVFISDITLKELENIKSSYSKDP